MKKLQYEEVKNLAPGLFNNFNALIKIISDEDAISKWQEMERENLNKQDSALDWVDIGVVLDDPRIVVLRDLR